MFDYLIKNANIVDGTGKDAYAGDIAIQGDKIAAIGKDLGEAKEIIDAKGLTVTPGFIDSHSHGDELLTRYRQVENLLLQGITTSMTGQCGTSAAPCFDPSCDDYELRTSVEKWFESLEKDGVGMNVSLFTGHGNIRKKVMGYPGNRDATPEEMQEMKDLLNKSIDEGSRGLNSGTYYAPCVYASTDEVVELCKTVAERGGMFSCHIRSESVRLLESVAEMIEISRRSGVRAVISHHKAAGGPNYWGLSEKTLKMIEDARAEGVDIWTDVYPFSACSTSLWATYFSPSVQALGKEAVAEKLNDPEFRKQCREWIEETFIKYSWKEKGLSWCMLVDLQYAYPEYQGLRINEAAAIHGKDEFDTLFDVLQANKMSGRGVLFTMNEEDVERIISKPYVMIGTDGAGVGMDCVHPRSTSSFTRAIAHYWRERKVCPFTEMIRKMTSLPAQVYKLENKGEIAVGKDADLCIFDPMTLKVNATFAQPNLYNEGFEYIFVNGKIAVRKDRVTGVLNGKVLRSGM